VEAGHAQRAPVAHPFAQHFPGVAQIVPVLPGDAEHVAEVFGLGSAQAEGDEGSQTLPDGSLEAV
jgi:hypothetical protein